MKGAFLLPSLLLTPDRVSSASSEHGLVPGTITPDATTNQGYLLLKPAGTPTTALTMDVKLQRGGNPTGYATPIDGTPGATVIAKPTQASSSQWMGYNDSLYLTYARNILGATITSDYPGFSRPRELGNGYLGFAYVNRASTNLLRFAYKASRTDSFTHATILTSGSPYTLVDDCAPDFVVLPSGRLICFFGVSGLASEVIAYYSDDHGATWALWSLDTYVPLSTARQLCAEYVQGAICLVVGRSAAGGAINPKIYWSADGGQSFSYTDTFTGGVPATTVTATGQVLLACDDTDSPDAAVMIYRVGIGSGADSVIASGTVAAAAPVHTMVTRDDGVVIGFNGGIYGPSSYIRARLSLDHGQSWHGFEFGSGTSFEILGFNGYSSFNRGWRHYRAGSWAGQIVLLAGGKGASGSLDDTLQELYFGGWDSLTEAPKGPTSGATPGYASPEGGIYVASDTPDAFGWAKVDTAAGATIALGNDGLSITASAADNSKYTAPALIFSTGSNPAEASVRMRFWFKWGSGAGLVAGRSRLYYAVSDGANLQWFSVNFGPDQMSIRDNSGLVVSSASVSNQFTAWTEVFIAFRHDYPSAGSGKISVWYRIAGTTYWTALATNTTIAEQAGATTQELSFGGTVGSACTWYVSGLTFATDDNGMVGGFTNPTDLAGRPVSPLSEMQLVYGLRVSAGGHLGVKGDTYDLATGYSYPATRLVENLRPSSFWRSSVDGADTNIVFDCGVSDIFEADTIALFGTNFRTATLQAHSSDSWGSPSVSVSLDATVLAISGFSAGMRGRIRLNTGDSLTPHQYRSTEGARWYLEVAGTSTTVYEISDNDADTILVEGIDFTTLVGSETLRIFGDRMSARFGRFGYRYVRLLIGNQDTSDGYYRAGTLILGKMIEISTPYAQGFRDRIDYRIQITEGVAGQRWMSKRGPQRRTLEIAWDPLYRPLQPWSQTLQAIHDASEGPLRGVVHWRDLEKANDIRLYQIKTPFVLENVQNEGREALERPAQVVLEEIL